MTQKTFTKPTKDIPQGNNKTYYVNGMHCASCEILIEKELSNLKDVKVNDVSLKNNCVVLTGSLDKMPTVDHLNNTFKDLGYSFSLEKNRPSKKLSADDIKKVIFIFLFFLLAFYLIEKSSFLMKYSLNSQSSVISYFIFGIIAGLSSCAALVGSILLSLSKQWNEVYNGNTKKSRTPFIYFNIARIMAFGFFGGILGIIGSYFKVSIELSSLITIVVSLLMLALGLQMLNVSWFKDFKIGLPKSLTKKLSDETNLKGKYMPLIVGALTFFVPCGFTLIAQSNAILSGSFLTGALSLMAFALGTLPVLALISFGSMKLYSNPNFASKFSLFSGLLVTFFALYTINSQLNVLGVPSLSDLKNPIKFEATKQIEQEKVANINNDVQLIQIEAKGFQYYPTRINIKSGVRTKLEIFNSGASGCAKAFYARGLYPEVVYLKQGLNSVEFIAPKPGTYKISCSMGMVPPITVNVYKATK